MVKITVNASKSYDVVIGSGILESLGARLSELKSYKKALVVTDKNVAPLYLEKVEKSLDSAEIQSFSVILESGEKSKNLKNYGYILEQAAKNKLNRGDIIVSLGGGVVSDIAGFAAATYMRGIDVVHVPTTLLAVIDAAIGGKTGVDLEQGKNLVGAFFQPRLVLCDIDTLKTLPDFEVKNAMGEGVKYAVLCGGELLNILEKGIDDQNLERFLEFCVSIKRDIVEEDEFEKGNRRLLNLGHTFGHAIEKLSGYKIRHGECVAKGIYIALKAGLKSGLKINDFERIENLLAKYNIDLSCPKKEDMINALKLDKKAEGKDCINFVAVNGIGDCAIKKMSFDELSDYVDGCL